ncbi:AsmA family protein, partial [Pseudomonas syringae]
GGRITVETRRGDLYTGNCEVEGTLEARPDTPVATVQPRIARVPVERSLEGQGQTPPVRGLLNLDSNLPGTGNSEKALIDSLNGTASFALNNGVPVNANLEQQLCKGISLLHPKPLGGHPRAQDTPFQPPNGNPVTRTPVPTQP